MPINSTSDMHINNINHAHKQYQWHAHEQYQRHTHERYNWHAHEQSYPVINSVMPCPINSNPPPCEARASLLVVYIASAVAACAYGRSKEHDQSTSPPFQHLVVVADASAPFGCADKSAKKHCWLIYCERKTLFLLKKQAKKYGL
jgi:hypothetical protein